MSSIDPFIDAVMMQVLGRPPVETGPSLKDVGRPLDEASAESPGRNVSAGSEGGPSIGRAIATSEGRTATQALIAAEESTPGVVVDLDYAGLELADSEGDPHASATVLRPREPLLPSGVSDKTVKQAAAEIAAGLRGSIVSSGMFYESHLARWLRGEFPLSLLTQEPQARDTDGSASAGMVSDQMNLMSSNVLQWEGQIWPGQWMTVRVQPPEPEETGVADGGDEHKSRKRAPGRWRVHVETRLPSLGPVTLDVALGKRYTRLDVRADDPIASLLASQKEALDARLSEMRIGRTYVSIQPNDAKGRRRVR